MAGIATARDVPRIERLEVVEENAANGDGGNSWGGHQSRIVRSGKDVYTAYTVPGADDTHRNWLLKRWTPNGWTPVAQGPSGREPMNLLVEPNGSLDLIAWPDESPVLWHWKRPSRGDKPTEAPVPGPWKKTDHSYGAAGIDHEGDLCVLESVGEKPGGLVWAYRKGARAAWRTGRIETDYRYCYTYTLPHDGGLSLVGTRDVLWGSLGWAQPKGAFKYSFSAVGFWHSPDVATRPFAFTPVAEGQETRDVPFVYCDAQIDNYEDTRGRIHVLYTRSDTATGGKKVIRHAVVEGGRVVKDVALPSGGADWRIIQDTKGRFYLLCSDGRVFPAISEDGTELGEPTSIDLRGHKVESMGYFIAAPRSGTKLADYVDGAFPSNDSRSWIYFRLRLR